MTELVHYGTEEEIAMCSLLKVPDEPSKVSDRLAL